MIMFESARKFFTSQEEEDIIQAIKNAELDTSGEIRVHIETSCKGDVMVKAEELFEQLEIKKTALRNGVLFFVAVKNRKFALICDEGIKKSVPSTFQNEINDLMLNYFREDQFVDGIIEGITLTGKLLKEYFPHQKDDVNELSDNISWEKLDNQ